MVFIICVDNNYLFICHLATVYVSFLKSYFLSLWLLQADVNVATFADETSDVLYSGSDDSLCKVSLITNYLNFFQSSLKGFISLI
jgi:hypothetical protein